MDVTLLNESGTRIEILSSIAAQMEASEQAKLVFAVPQTEPEFKKMQTTDFRYVVWGRLYSLGYAKFKTLESRRKPGKKNTSISISAQYKEAVKVFQRDASAVDDGWVGLQTWESMQELFTFEQDANLEKWFQPQYEDILYRATHLRLMMLGLVDKPYGNNRATGKYDDVQACLALWRLILGKLSPDNFNNSTEEHTLIEWLFDIDRLTKLISANYGDLRSLAASQHVAPSFREVDSLRFQKSLLKIELWLYGVEGIQPGNLGPKHKVSYVPEEKRKNRDVNPLMLAVSEFLDECNVHVETNIANDESRLIELTLKYLASLDDDEIQKSSEEKQANMLNKRLEELPQEKHEKVLKTMKNKKHDIGAWLFDGAKRVFRWLKNILVSAVNWVKKKAKQINPIIDRLASGAKRLATDAYNFIKRGFQVLVDGFKFFNTPTYIAKDNAIIIHKKLDMDTIVVINNEADAANVKAFWEKMAILRLRARAAMVLANLIIEEAISIIKNLIFQGPIAVVSLLISIYKMRNSEVFHIIKQAYATY
jgi:hypothetical protein